MSSRNAHDFSSLEVPGAGLFDGLPGGRIGHNHRTIDATGIGGTDTTVLTEDVPVNAGRSIEVKVMLELGGLDAGETEIAVRVFRDSALLRRYIVPLKTAPNAGNHRSVAFIANDDGPASGTHTYRVDVRDESGGHTFSVIVNPGIDCVMNVEDVGPWPL